MNELDVDGTMPISAGTAEEGQRPRVGARGRAGYFSRRMTAKVPEVTAFFWITKVLTTGMGETTSDYLAHHLDPVVAVALSGLGLLSVLVVQLALRRYVAWAYWAAVVMVSVFGTMAADVLHVGFGIPYAASTTFFAAILVATFAAWHACERTLSIHSITTWRRELFYWATVMTTFALGTAAGDLTAVTLRLGYFTSGVLFAALIALPALAYWRLHLDAIAAFWCAYIVTRPLGASFADWLGVPPERGGLNLGTGPVSLVLLLVIAVCVGYLAAMHTATGGDMPARIRGDETRS